MQQTENLKLNLIETGDPISPIPLNENMDKVEGALDGLTANHATLEQRVTAIESHKIAIGGYYGEEVNNKTVNLGFTPQFVLVAGVDDGACGLITQKYPRYADYHGAVCGKIVEGGFALYDGRPLAGGGYRYNYVAFA